MSIARITTQAFKFFSSNLARNLRSDLEKLKLNLGRLQILYAVLKLFRFVGMLEHDSFIYYKSRNSWSQSKIWHPRKSIVFYYSEKIFIDFMQIMIVP
jgi:hypothetical protein